MESNKRSEFVKAMISARSEAAKTIKADTTGAYGKYALLADILKEINPILEKYQLLLHEWYDDVDEVEFLYMQVEHINGETSRISSVKIQHNPDIKKIGMWKTYSRRYIMQAIFGFHNDKKEDDDGEGLTPSEQDDKQQDTKQKWDNDAPLSKYPGAVIKLKNIISRKQNGDQLEKQILDRFDAESLGDIPAGNFNALKDLLEKM